MATADQVLADLEPLVRSILDLPNLTLEGGLTASEIENWDSLNHVRILSAVEQRFAVRLTAAEVERLKSVGDLVALIVAKVPA